MASSLWEPQSRDCRADDSRKVQVTILASEWGSSKGGLSTINRELAIHLAKYPEVEITFFLPQCSQEDKKVAMKHNVKIIEATPLPGFEEQLDWLCLPPEDLQMDIIISHGVKLGKQVQIIKRLKKCKWVQVVHTDPEELGMFKSYSNPISKGEEKHKTEVELCKMADHVVGVGPKLSEAFRSYLRSCQKDDNVVDFTPGVFEEFATVKHAPSEGQQRSVLVFGRGDAEDFKLKGFDIAGKAVSELEDTRLVFVGAPDGKHEEIAKQLTECGVPASRLRVRGFVEDRESLRRLFQEVDLVVMPSRTEGFGLAGLEALSAALPVLVSCNSGFGKALHSVPFGSTYVVSPEKPADWTSAIKTILGKDRRSRLEEAKMLRESYGKKYNWAKQIKDLIDKMIIWVYDDSLDRQSSSETKRRIFPSTDKASQQMEGTTVDPEVTGGSSKQESSDTHHSQTAGGGSKQESSNAYHSQAAGGGSKQESSDTHHSQAAALLPLRMDCVKIVPQGPQGETTEVEAQSVFQETGHVLFNSNRPQTVATTDPQDVLAAPGTSEKPRVEVSSGSRRANVENRAVPSPQEILSSISSKYLQKRDFSTPEDFNEFVQYIERVRRAVVVDVTTGSIIVMVECVSLEILEELWEDYNSGHLNEIAQKFLVTEEILKAFGLAEVKLSTTIKVEDYKSCRELLLKIAARNFFPSLQNLQWDAEQVSEKTNLPSDLRAIAANKGFVVSDNQASENCLFHSLSEQLQSVKGIRLSHKELRKTLVQFLDENPNLHDGTSLLNFVSGYASWREYLQSMAKDSTWGDHVVLFAAANFFQTPIRIISSLDREIVVHPEHTVADSTPLVLGHIHEFHYVSLQPKQVCVKSFQPTVMQGIKRERDVAEDSDEEESKILKSSEDTPSSSEGSDGNTHQITARRKKRKRERKERTLKECIRDPPELNKVLPSLADIKAITRPSKHADLPVDVLLLTVKDCEFLACFSELKNPYRCWFDGLGHVYFSDVDGSQDKVKVALFKCYENSSCPGGSLVSVKNAATLLRPKAVISVGACSGLHPEKSNLGDVVVSAKLTTYASKVVINNQEQSTGMRSYVSKGFLDVIKNCADGWKAPLKNLADAQQVQVYTSAEFLSGPEQVISEQRRDQLAETNPQAIAMENEGEGVFTAAFDCQIEWLIVKGIADYADGSQLASESWSSCASVMAASLVAHMLNEPRVFHSWPHYQGPQPQELITHYDETSVAPFIERMKKHVRDVTDKPYRDLKSPFHNPGEGPRRDLKLDEIFPNLIVYEGRAKYDFSGDRVKQLNEYHKANESLRPTLPGDIFNAKEQKILVVGRPGIGKTLFSTKILRNWASDNLFNETQKSQVDFKVAFLVKLRMFNSRNQELNLREILDHSEYSTALSEELWTYIRHNPERVLLIFDGFDEYTGRAKINEDDIPYRNSEEERMPVYFLMKKIVEGKILTGATILTTTRPNAVSCITRLHFDKTVEILGFSTEQVNNYVEKFTKEADKAETIKQHITSNLNLVAFCYIPVNCFIICSCLLELLGNTGFTSLPTRLTEIYSIAVRMFYFSYDDDQYRHNKTAGQQYFLKPFKELPSSVQNVFTRLGKIAFNGIQEGRLIFESHEVKRLKSNGLFHRLPDTKDHPLAEGREQYCFLHLTIQEFFAAKYLVDEFKSKKLRKFVSAHIRDGAWKVVMQFVAGLLAEKEGQSTDIFSDLLPSKTVTEKVKIKMNEDSEKRYETLTCWPAGYEDRALVVTLFNCRYENKASDQEVQKKLAEIGCNALDFFDCELSPLDCLALVHALKSVEGILNFNLAVNNLQSLGCIEIAKLLPGNQHNRGFCKLKTLSLWGNKITDEGVKHLSTALTHTNCTVNSLNLQNNNITDEGVKHLSTALTHTNCTLNSLILGYNNITDEGVKRLSTALTRTNCTLNSLYLDNNNITDEGVKHLVTALTHTNCTLDSLDLEGNNITDKGKNLLNSVNITCEVII